MTSTKLKLTRAELAKALTEVGYKFAESSLATLASRGGGPPYQYWGNAPLYEWESALEWAQQRLSKIVSTTAEAGRRRTVGPSRFGRPSRKKAAASESAA